MIFFYITVLLVLWLMHLIVGSWLGAYYPVLGVRGSIGYFPFLGALLCMGGMWFSRLNYGVLGQIAYYLSYIWFGFVFLAFCLCGACWMVRGVLHLFHMPYQWMGMASLGALAVIFAMALWGGFSAPKVKRMALRVPGIPKMKIALLADSHLGMGVSLARFDKAMTRLEAEEPDVLFGVGDIFEYGPYREKYAARIAQTKFPLGVYGVLGNHEYYVGYGESKQFFKEAGIELLENSAAVLPNGVQVVGLKDIHTAGVTEQDVEQLLSTLDKNKPVILLSHTPLYAETAARNGANLMFSGHTHNGQLWPFHYLVHLQFPRVYGLFDVEGMEFYITSGLFYWGIPLRFLAPAEIPIIEVN